MKKIKSSTVSDSEFQMWRAVFALAHTDGVITGGEIQFMAEALEDIPFSSEQNALLKEDIKKPKNVVEMFKSIPDPKDQARFFKFAHDMVWADGEYSEVEQKLLLELQSAHVRSTDVDALIGKIDLEFEDGNSSMNAPAKKRPPKKGREIVFSFREQFMKTRFKD